MALSREGTVTPASGPPVYMYKAFISYSHAADGMLAPKLQSGLHQFAKPWYRLRAMRVFRDQTSLSNTPELWPSIEAALSRSEYLVLLASPDAAESPWVRKEIEYWISNRSKETLLIALTGGSLQWDGEQKTFDWVGTTSLPQGIDYPFDDEPRYTDLRDIDSAGKLSLRNPAFRAAIADFSSTLLGVNKDELIGEDLRRHRQTKRISWAAISALVILTAASIFAANTAIQNQRAAELRQQIAESRQLAVESDRQNDSGNIELALLLAVEATRVHDTVESRRALLKILQDQSKLEAIMQRDPGFAASGRSIAFSPDGSLLATTGTRYPVVLWDVKKRRSITPALRGDLSNSNAVEFSPDGRRVAAAGEGGAVLIWDVDTGQQVGPPLVHQRNALSLAFRPDGKVLATGGCAESVNRQCRSGYIVLWDLDKYAPMGAALIGHENAVRALTFSHDGSMLASGGAYGTVLLWETNSHQVSGEPLESGIPGLRTLSFSADDRRLAAIGEHGNYIRWTVGRGNDAGKPGTLYNDPFISLFDGHDRGSGRLSNLPYGDSAPLSGRQGPDTRVWAARGRLLATIGNSHTPLLFNTRSSGFPVVGGSGIDFRHPTMGSWQSKPFAISSDATTIATIERNGTVTLRQIGSTEPYVSWEAGLGWPLDSSFTPKMAFSPDGGRLAVSGCARFQGNDERPPQERYWKPACVLSEVGVWDIASQQPVIEPFTDHKGSVLAAVFIPDGDRLVTYGVDGSRAVRSLRNGIVSIQEPPESGLHLGVHAVSRDGERLVASEQRNSGARLLLWDRGDKEIDTPRIWSRSSSAGALVFNELDRSLTISGSGSAITRWDPESRQPLAMLLELANFFPTENTYAVRALAISPNGKMLATESDRGTIVWDLASRKPLFEQDWVESRPLFFGADGTTLVAGSRIIDVNLDSWRRHACSILNRNLSWNEWNLYLGEDKYRATCEDIDLAPGDLAAQADYYAGSGQTEAGRKALAEAVELAQDRGQPTNESICETGGFTGLGKTALPACDRSIRLSLGEPAWFRHSLYGQRAVARALAGDLRGAVEDLKVDLDGLNKRGVQSFQDRIDARQQWLKSLEAGNSPFDPETLYELRME